MTKYDVDLFVIGAGSAGVRTARAAADKGIRVTIAEERNLGGTCVNVGCIPKKFLVYASQFSEDFASAEAYGWQLASPSFNWSTFVDHKNKEITRLNKVYAKLLVDSGVEIIKERAQIVGANSVRVGDKIITAERILIATGGWPFVPEVVGKAFVVTSNDMFNLKALPKRLLIVGGGYIAVEFAGIMHGLGVEVTIAERSANVLKGFDTDMRDFLVDEMQKKGIQFRFNCNVEKIEKVADTFIAKVKDGDDISTDLVLYATGRVPNTSKLGLDKVGVKVDKSQAVIINADYQTNIPSIYAIGDVTNRISLTPVAIAEAIALVNKLYGNKDQKVDYVSIPTAVFSQPSMATVGLTEAEARKEYGDQIAIFMTDFKPLKNIISGSKERTLMKMIVVKSTDRVVGIHMVGVEAAEIIQGMALALRAGATKAIFDSTIGIHPTAAEEFVTMRTPVR